MSLAASSTSRSRLNSTRIDERSSLLDEVSFSIPSSPAIRSSITWVTLVSIT
jgi:hypothetical protein